MKNESRFLTYISTICAGPPECQMFLFGQDSDCVNLFIVKACGEHLLTAHEIEECVEISWRKYMYTANPFPVQITGISLCSNSTL